MSKKMEARRDHLAKIGLNPDDVVIWSHKWQNLNTNSKQAGNRNDLSFEQYTNLAAEAGIKSPNDVGSRKGLFQLARYGDVGNYQVGNCRFVRSEINKQEWIMNGGRDSMRDKKTGVNRFINPNLASSRKGLSLDCTTKQKMSGSSAKARLYWLISPNGEVFEGKNLAKFARDNGLPPSKLQGLCRGDVAKYKGWIGKYIVEGKQKSE